MAIEVFNRYEYKYLIDSKVAKKLISNFNERLLLDEFCKKNNNYTIINHYVDTINYQLIRDSLSKPVYKHKLRIRMYEPLRSYEDFVFFEIKKKFRGIVNKRRCKLTYKECLDMIYKNKKPEIKPYMNKQILNEIYFILQSDTYELKSKIEYDRVAFFDETKSLRISFDYNIHSQRISHIDDGLMLMEIKTPNSIPLWLVEILNEYEIKKTSFSKYGIDYLEIIKEKYDKSVTY